MIPTQVLPTMPGREKLRALYDAAVREINATRQTIDLTTGFYAETGDGVFDACYLALSDACKGTKGPRRVHVVSAPVGGGKTSFSYAFLVALTRHAETTPDAPYGCVFVVDQIEKADKAYRELHALLPGKVAVWTTDHDRGCKTRTKVLAPAAQFTRDELRLYPIIIVTHVFYNGPKGNKAHLFVRDGHVHNGRALIVVDERPEEVEVYETTLTQAQDIREKLEANRPDLSAALDKLLLFMMPYTLNRQDGNSIVRATDHFGLAFVSEQLHWFTTNEAERIAKEYAGAIPGLSTLFGFARAMTLGCAFAVPGGTVVRFVGWQSKLMVRQGTVLLDATADIDGVSLICPWREHTKVPQANYANLEITHVPQHTKTQLSEYLKKAANQRAYVGWMVETIKEQMAPGERGLVICKKVLFDAERVPQWPEGDPRFKDPESYTKRYEWNIEGRLLCATHWGTGVGSNDWKDADVVFLFDEFFIPRRVAAATVQGLNGHRATEGALGSMTTLNSKSRGVDIIADGHRLRWTKQLALRGRARCYDAHGLCGKQRLVVSSELKGFMSHAGRLFPGAVIRTVGDHTDETTRAGTIIKLLSNPELPPVLTTRQIGTLSGKPWRSVSSNVVTPEFREAIAALGWTYVPGRGRRQGRFVRTTPTQIQGAQGVPEDIHRDTLSAASAPVVPSGRALGQMQ